VHTGCCLRLLFELVTTQRVVCAVSSCLVQSLPHVSGVATEPIVRGFVSHYAPIELAGDDRVFVYQFRIVLEGSMDSDDVALPRVPLVVHRPHRQNVHDLSFDVEKMICLNKVYDVGDRNII